MQSHRTRTLSSKPPLPLLDQSPVAPSAPARLSNRCTTTASHTLPPSFWAPTLTDPSTDFQPPTLPRSPRPPCRQHPPLSERHSTTPPKSHVLIPEDPPGNLKSYTDQPRVAVLLAEVVAPGLDGSARRHGRWSEYLGGEEVGARKERSCL